MCFNDRFEIEDVSLDALMKALDDVIARVNKAKQIPAVREIRRDVYTIKDKMSFIKERLAVRKSILFSELFSQDRSKSEVVTTFLAMLELWKNHYLRITQNELFSEIIVIKTESERSGD